MNALEWSEWRASEQVLPCPDDDPEAVGAVAETTKSSFTVWRSKSRGWIVTHGVGLDRFEFQVDSLAHGKAECERRRLLELLVDVNERLDYVRRGEFCRCADHMIDSCDCGPITEHVRAMIGEFRGEAVAS